DVPPRPYLEPLPRSNRSPAWTALLASPVRGAANPRSRHQQSAWRARSRRTTPSCRDGRALCLVALKWRRTASPVECAETSRDGSTPRRDLRSRHPAPSRALVARVPGKPVRTVPRRRGRRRRREQASAFSWHQLKADRHSQACAATRRSANGRLLRPQGWQGIRAPFDTRVAAAFGLTLSTSRARGCLQNEIRPGAAPYSGRPPLSTDWPESLARTPIRQPAPIPD